MRSNICVIIPARGGSKRIKRKNLLKINGETLLDLCIKDALRMSHNVIVTTDSKMIADTAAPYGVKIVDRPKNLSGDHVHSIEAVKHSMQFTAAKWIVMLNCTAPVEYNDVYEALEVPRECFAVVPFRGFVYNKFGKCINWTDHPRPRSQDQEQFKEHGGFYMFKNNSNIDHQVVPNAEMIVVRETYEIDTAGDYQYAQFYHR